MGLNNLDDSKEGIGKTFDSKSSIHVLSWRKIGIVEVLWLENDGRRGLYLSHTAVNP